MKLQLALDFHFDVDSACRVIDRTRPFIDIIEVGTPFIMEWGLEPVRELKDRYPDKTILADLKIADAGQYEAAAAFRMGADVVTALAVTDDATISRAGEAAREWGGRLMVDMLCARQLPQRLGEVDGMGADLICLHTGKDLQKLDQDAARAFGLLRGCVKRAELALAGGIHLENIEEYASIHPDVIIIGEGLTAARDPGGTAEKLKAVMNQYG